MSMRRVAGFGVVVAAMVYGCAGGASSSEQYLTEAGVDTGVGPLMDSSTPTPETGAFDSSAPADAQTCTNNDDCTGPNLCQGNNGFECLAGLCVPSGKPANCDDGIPCTTDTCDATTNSCVHTPDDSDCMPGYVCSATMGCVMSLPCTPGDSVCDRLDTDACAGLWTCDPKLLTCVQGSVPCEAVTNAKTSCVDGKDGGVEPDGGANVTCSWTCDPSYVHIAWTGGVPKQVTSFGAPPPAGGCECHQTSTTDEPDLGFVDSNCDGIDGTITHSIFVDSVSGSPTGDGSMKSPVQTIAQGIALAESGGKDVLVSKGTYDEAVTMVDGVSLYGGYDASNDWQRSDKNVTVISSPSATGVSAVDLTTSLTVQLFTILSADAPASGVGPGNSSIGVLVANRSGTFTIAGCHVTSGSGSAGAGGTSGATGGNGSPGMASGGGRAAGAGGAGCNGANGGAGGEGGASGVNNGSNGSVGTTVTGGASGGSNGLAETDEGSCSLTSSGPGQSPGQAPGVGTAGGAGLPGSPTATSLLGTFSSAGVYQPPVGTSGQSGATGGGGGGAAGGGGTAHGTDGEGCTNCSGLFGGGGGGGGGGACGGGGGTSGYGGGGSFAIAIVNTTTNLTQNVLGTKNGGAGGPGGNGASGGLGAGGGGGAGGQSDCETLCGCQNGGTGGTGAAGGNGGSGGSGPGGAGGPSICIVYSGAAPSQSSTTCPELGSGGTGGPGGTPASTPSNAGNSGLSVESQATP